MIGLGTLINTAAVIVGSVVGMIVNQNFRQKYQEILMQGTGLAVIFIGISGTLSHMLTIEGGSISTQGTMLMIFSMVLGGLLGEWIDIEEKLERVGVRLKDAVAKVSAGKPGSSKEPENGSKDNRFVEGFVNCSLVICVGAMAIVGSIQDGLTGDYSLLTAKAVLDLVIVVIFAATYGLGVLFSAIPIFLYQGGITLLAHLIGNTFSEQLIANLSMVGSALIFCVGMNLVFGKKFRTGNLLPALLVPVLYEWIQGWI